MSLRSRSAYFIRIRTIGAWRGLRPAPGSGGCRRPAEEVPPPLLGPAEVVEGEHVEPGDVGGTGNRQVQAADDLARVVAAGQEEAPQQLLLLSQEARRAAQPDGRRDADELLPGDSAWDADPDREVHV